MISNTKLMGFAAITDVARARDFYETALGLRFIGDDGYALVMASGANIVRLQKMQTHAPLPFTVLGWQVDDIRAAVRDLASRGVQFERYEFLPQDELGVWEAGDDRVAWFKDPDGNLLSLAQLGQP